MVCYAPFIGSAIGRSAPLASRHCVSGYAPWDDSITVGRSSLKTIGVTHAIWFATQGSRGQRPVGWPFGFEPPFSTHHGANVSHSACFFGHLKTVEATIANCFLTHGSWGQPPVGRHFLWLRAARSRLTTTSFHRTPTVWRAGCAQSRSKFARPFSRRIRQRWIIHRAVLAESLRT